jgi:hypothetical protein
MDSTQGSFWKDRVVLVEVFCRAQKLVLCPGEISDTLSLALRYQGRKRIHDVDDLMARMTAARLVTFPWLTR